MDYTAYANKLTHKISHVTLNSNRKRKKKETYPNSGAKDFHLDTGDVLICREAKLGKKTRREITEGFFIPAVTPWFWAKVLASIRLCSMAAKEATLGPPMRSSVAS